MAGRQLHRLDPGRRHRQPGRIPPVTAARQHRLRLGQRVQHDPAVRDRELAAAHPGDLRGRRGARLRPPVPGAAVPALDRHRRHLGSRAAEAGGAVTATRSARPAGTGTSPRSRTCTGTTGGAATTRPGPSSRRSRRRWAPHTSRACRAARQRSLRAAATVKHFAGYSQSINGHDRIEAQLPLSYLQDVFLPSYAGGIDAGAAPSW